MRDIFWFNSVCNMNQLCLMHVCHYRTVQHKGERLDHDSPWVASFHTVSAGWPRLSPGLSVDSWTEDLQRQNRVQHLPLRHICRETNYTKVDVIFSEQPTNAACLLRQDIWMRELPSNIQVKRYFDSSCKEKCLVKSKVGCGKITAVPWGDLMMRPNR